MSPESDSERAASDPFDSRLLLTWLLLTGGFGYVAIFLCGRTTPFESGDNLWNDWLGVTLSAPAIYLFGTRHTLPPFRAENLRAVFGSSAGFGLLFFASLHWEYVGRLSGANFSLTAYQLTHLNLASKVALGLGVGIAGGMTAWCVREGRKASFLGSYLACFFALLGALTVVSYALRAHHSVHIHHYFWSLCGIPFVRFRHPLCVVMQGFLAGVFVEGAARYGLSPIWILHQ